MTKLHFVSFQSGLFLSNEVWLLWFRNLALVHRNILQTRQLDIWHSSILHTLKQMFSQNLWELKIFSYLNSSTRNFVHPWCILVNQNLSTVPLQPSSITLWPVSRLATSSNSLQYFNAMQCFKQTKIVRPVACSGSCCDLWLQVQFCISSHHICE